MSVSRKLVYLLFACHFINVSLCTAQTDPKWDDTKSKDWPDVVKQVSIPSSADGTSQQAYFYAAPQNGKRPLVISLHTWSGDFKQKDTVANICISKGFNYIHPDFRGPNRRPEACGSDLVVSDIDDAISWAVANTQTDPENIHVIGVSGGGYATVLTYMRSKHKIRSFSAYAGLYNVVDWYYECLGRNARYAGDVAASTSGDRNKFILEEAKKRSPYYMQKPVADRKDSKLYIYCGVHDGYTGSVPISHSLKMYNKLVTDADPTALSSLLPEEYIHKMTRERALFGHAKYPSFRGRTVLYQNHYDHRIQLTVFEGGHEMPAGDVLSHVPSRNILAIGDSNGALEYGWVNQLRDKRPDDNVLNTCISGNTIGFDNLDKKELNTLRNVDAIFEKMTVMPDAVVIMLGTNDCKAIFADRLREVPGNMNRLIELIREKTKEVGKVVPVYLVSPPPFASDDLLTDKYKGGAKRIEYLLKEFKKIAERTGCTYIDTHSRILPAYPYLTKDGIHLLEEGQRLIASIIDSRLDLFDVF